MVKNNDLEVYISKDSHTIPIMDKFEKYENGVKIYNRMIINNIEKASIGLYLYSYKLIVERIDYRDKKTVGNITMSEFKDHKGKVTQYAKKCLMEYLKNHNIKIGKEVYFNSPYYLRAQNSSNREGYGWEWEWDNLIYEGTEYGECDNYGFVGVIIDDIVLDREKHEELLKSLYETIPDPIKIEVTYYHGDKYYKAYEDDTNVYLFPFDGNLTQKEIIQSYKKLMYKYRKKKRKQLPKV